LTVSEFIHDERDYEFEFKELGKAKPIVQKEILPLILEVLYKFQDDLIKAHSKDVQE
jgi:activator of HSP90 ATPase